MEHQIYYVFYNVMSIAFAEIVKNHRDKIIWLLVLSLHSFSATHQQIA